MDSASNKEKSELNNDRLPVRKQLKGDRIYSIYYFLYQSCNENRLSPTPRHNLHSQTKNSSEAVQLHNLHFLHSSEEEAAAWIMTLDLK